MILPEKQIIRTPIENMLLKEMQEEDMALIVNESMGKDAVDDLSTSRGLFDNTSSDEDLEDFLDGDEEYEALFD